MTVCIAAICQNHYGYPMVIGATDRMMTAGDIEFEPPIAKVWQLTPQIVALNAGEANAQAEICARTQRFQPRSVEHAVRTYCRQLAKYNIVQAERKVLAPFGLTMKSFLEMQCDLSPSFVEQLRYDIKRERAGIQTIICGVDGFGAHIYSIDEDGSALCHNPIGFVAIGGGQWHASSQFMFGSYSPQMPLARALVLLSYAKERAAVAPGVGQQTDFFFMGNEFQWLAQTIRDDLLAGNEMLRGVLELAWEDIAGGFSGRLDAMLYGEKAPQEAATVSVEEDPVGDNSESESEDEAGEASDNPPVE